MNQTIKHLLTGLIILIIVDFISTIVAVGYMGATELNPVYNLGLIQFMVIKLVLSIVCIGVAIKIETIAKVPCLGVLLMFYLVIVLNNLYGMVNYLLM